MPVKVVPHLTALLWGLSQHSATRQQVLADGRWSTLLLPLLRPVLRRLSRAATAGVSLVPSASGTSIAVPSLNLSSLASGFGGEAGGATAAAATRSSYGNVPSAPRRESMADPAGTAVNASLNPVKLQEALQVLHLSLQSVWLLLVEAGEQLQAAQALPQGVTRVYQKGDTAWWGLALTQPK